MTIGLGFALSASALAQAPAAHTVAPAPGAPRAGQPAVKQPVSQPHPQIQPGPGSSVPQQPAPQQPVLPPRPEQMAPVAPQVTYQNGQLSILAQNSTLSSILSAVKAHTGAQVEMPPDTASDRVATQLGPGNPRDVLASLLAGSRFDYIFIGSPTDPDSLAQVIITQHAGAGGGGATPVNTAVSQPMQGGNPQPGMPRIAGGAGRPEIPSDEEETASEPQPMPEPPQEAPQPAPIVSPGGDRGDTGQQQNPNQVKTPEQMLQELQRMQQIQQQQQQQEQQQQQPQQQQPQQQPQQLPQQRPPEEEN
jgi:hypothetical protein